MFCLKTRKKILWKQTLKTQDCLIRTEVRVDKKAVIYFYKDLRIRSRYFMTVSKNFGWRRHNFANEESFYRHKQKFLRDLAAKNMILQLKIAETSFKPAKVDLKRLKNRSSENRISIISRVVPSGTIVHSDQGSAYNNLSLHKFTHKTVNHTLYFVDHFTSVHTQSMKVMED